MMRLDALPILVVGVVIGLSPISLADQMPPIERFLTAESVEWIDPITTRLSLYINQAGRLVLLDAELNEVQRASGNSVFVVHAWQMENADELEDQLFFVRFMPVDGLPFQRLLRVTPGEDVQRELTREERQWVWRDVEKLSVPRQVPSEREQESSPEPWISISALDEELDSFIQQLAGAGIQMPEEEDLADELRVRGLVLIGEGLYAEALLLLRQSFAIHAASELEDRIQRLELYLDVRTQAEP